MNGQSTAKWDIFISHASQDKNIVDSACAVLEQHGLKCWVAPRDILPGVNWAEAILAAIGSSRVMLLVFSGLPTVRSRCGGRSNAP